MRNASNAPARLPILSQTAEHALRAVLYLARHHQQGLVSANEVAGALGAPPNYLAKTLRQLARRGLLRSVRGAQGGFALRVAPDVLTTADVLAAVDDVQVAATCLMGDHPCDRSNPCAAHERWTSLTERVLQPMSQTTIAQLLGAGAPASDVAAVSDPAPER